MAKIKAPDLRGKKEELLKQWENPKLELSQLHVPKVTVNSHSGFKALQDLSYLQIYSMCSYRHQPDSEGEHQEILQG